MRSILCVTLLTIIFSCQTKPKQETLSTATAEDSAAILAKRPGPDAPRSAADRLGRALYFEHRKKENPLLETKDRTLIDQFFINSTADRIWRNTSRVKQNQTKVNPLFDAPDEAVKKPWVLPAAVAGSKAVVYVTFEKNAKPQEIRIDMQQVAGRWRIVDMLYPSGKRLTDIM
jgi:hypothetical protein